jgi:hypothetical protein
LTDGNKPRALSKILRAVGGVVILATIVVVILMALWLFAPGFTSYSRYAEDLFVRSLVASMTVSGLGGFLMLVETKNPWWLLALLAVGGTTALWLLIGSVMGSSM